MTWNGCEANTRGAEDIIEASDEEVLAYSDEDSDIEASEVEEESDAEGGDGESAGSGDEREAEDEDEINAWGASKADYYNTDVIETEQDALEEEKEARRLQQKRLKALKEADFGFDEEEWLGQGEEEEEAEDGIVTEILPQLQITEDMDSTERLKLLKTRYPEFEPLAKQLTELQPLHTQLSEAVQAAHREKDSNEAATPIEVMKFRALSAYLGALAMYFVVLTSTATDDKVQSLPLAPHVLQSHGVMDSLVRSRENWEMVKDLEEMDSEMASMEHGTDESDSDLIAAEVEDLQTNGLLRNEKSKMAKNSSAEPPTSATTAASLARRAARLRRTEESLAALSQPSTTAPRRQRPTTTKTAATSATTTHHSDVDSDIGDEPALEGHEAAEKARRKKSLRFYTSQIAQRANKRANAGRAAGGDDDVPYRERFRDKQDRLVKEAENRGKKGNKGKADGTELRAGSDDEGEETTNRQREEKGSGDEGDYATALESRVLAKKAAKHARSAAYAEAKESGGVVVRVEERNGVGADGRREVGYAIEKNKGLMPRRKKDVKNPRVKKRKKFEEKTRKLKSMKPVYAGGEGKGGYKGELTGIKKGLVRSVKF